MELFFALDLFSLSDPSSGLLLFKNIFLCNLNFFDSVVFHIPSALGSWVLAFVVFFMWMEGFFVLNMPALFAGFAVCEYFHVVGFLQGLNAVVDVDMGFLLLVLDFQVMLYLNGNCFCWA